MCCAGKGWYNLNETNYDTYCFSKLRRLLALTRYMMEDTLRSLVTDNQTKFLAFVQLTCSGQVQCAFDVLKDQTCNVVLSSDGKSPRTVDMHAVNSQLCYTGIGR